MWLPFFGRETRIGRRWPAIRNGKGQLRAFCGYLEMVYAIAPYWVSANVSTMRRHAYLLFATALELSEL